MVRRSLKQLAGCVGVLVVTGLLFAGLTRLLERGDNRQDTLDGDVRIQPFFEEENGFDVLVFGTSHAIYAIEPMKWWDNYGIASYNLAQHNMPIATTYWVMKNALDYTTPRLIVVDCYGAASPYKVAQENINFHMTFDPFPFSLTKVQTVLDLFDNTGFTGENEERTILSVLWSYLAFHSRWNELTKADFQPFVLPTKGGGRLYRWSLPAPEIFVPRYKKLSGEIPSLAYLRRLIEECQEQNIEVLLTYLPFPAKEANWLEANSIYEIADEFGLNYLNFLTMDVVNYETDCADSMSHLNPSGAGKVTEYLGSYIKEHYDLPDRREDPAYAGWKSDYKDYIAYKARKLQEQQTLNLYLVLLADEDFDFYLEITDPDILQKKPYTDFLANLGVTVPKTLENGSIFASRCGDVTVWDTVNDLSKFNADVWGMTKGEDGSIYVDGEKYMPPLADTAAEIRIITFDHQTRDVVDAVGFTSGDYTALR